jgi:hypothetical protein
MGLLNIFSKTDMPGLSRLPSGSFTMDRDGEIIISTVSSSFPAETVQDIGRQILDTFRQAQEAHLPLSELIIHFGGFKVVARELRGGAIVFLNPKYTITPTKQP